MKSIYYFFVLLIMPTLLFSQDSSKVNFDAFLKQLEVYKTTLDSAAVVYTFPCEKYVLKWTNTIYNNEESYIKANRDSISLCADLKQFKEVNLKTYKKKDVYGSWMYDFERIGEKYVVISGEQGISSISLVIHYYESEE